MKKILIVDDDKDILMIVELLLNAHGYKVQTIFDPTDIVEDVKRFRPGVILMDVNIGQHDGREICKTLKSDALVQSIPIILFSAMHNLQETHRECEATDFIVKPFDSLELIKIIEKHLKSAA
ncbi:MAG: response regulator [Ginsengibacter sp.]